MNLSTVLTRAQSGMHAHLVCVETHISNGLPAFSIVGLPEAAVRESRDRVRSALINSGFEFPNRRITINLAPADLPKQGGRYDLAIALGLLTASGQVPVEAIKNSEFIGELALSGTLKSVKATLPSAIACGESGRRLFIARESLSELKHVGLPNIFGATSLGELVAHFHEKNPLPNTHDIEIQPIISLKESAIAPDLADVKGQTLAKRALAIAASGGHHLLFYGPPGTGKSMLASRLPSILPGLDNEQAIAVATLYSLAGLNRPLQTWHQCTFRAPHHSASAAAIVGGGSKPKPGEISLAHHGILFLDELPEFSRQVLEMLREPLETKHVLISRAEQAITFPANFQLIAAMNPCPCGYLGHPTIPCRDTPQQIQTYRRKLSGPLLDRFDLQVEVPFQSAHCLFEEQAPEASSAEIRERVVASRLVQMARQGCLNSALDKRRLDDACALSHKQQTWLVDVTDKLALSARAMHRIMKVARSLADYQQQHEIEMKHLQQALAYRGLRGARDK